MARLTSEQWVEMRAEWEASPRQGLTWLTAAAGGRWSITEEAIRRKRAADNWQKRGDPVLLARAARQAADDLAARRAAATQAGSPDGVETDALGTEPRVVARAPDKVGAPEQSENAEADDPQVALRTQLMDMHRREWKAVRGVVYALLEAVRAEPGKPAPAFGDRLKVARVVPRALEIIQAGERRTWGLDADLIDFDAMSDAQLEAMSKGRAVR